MENHHDSWVKSTISTGPFSIAMLNYRRVTNITGAKRGEWMGVEIAGMIIDSCCSHGSFPQSLLSTSKISTWGIVELGSTG